MVTRTRGRPRSFDRATALERALLSFWEHGYDATSIADLTRTMGIGAPSLYAAFGDKKTLFEEVLRLYTDRYGFVPQALDEEATAYAAIARVLREAAAEYTEPGRPAGCLILSDTAQADASRDAAHELRLRRAWTRTVLGRRLREGVAAGELPSDTDTDGLARFVQSVVIGMSQQAREGASREELEAVAEAALRAWPAASDPKP
ncbi:TetR/AcrR family transcriptional regulator [Streptomyces xiamenensis]